MVCTRNINNMKIFSYKSKEILHLKGRGGWSIIGKIVEIKVAKVKTIKNSDKERYKLFLEVTHMDSRVQFEHAVLPKAYV